MLWLDCYDDHSVLVLKMVTDYFPQQLLGPSLRLEKRYDDIVESQVFTSNISCLPCPDIEVGRRHATRMRLILHYCALP